MKSDATVRPMGTWRVTLLMIYLTAVFAVGGMMVWSFWGIQIAEEPRIEIPDFGEDKDSVVVVSVQPKRLVYGQTRSIVHVYGHGFSKETRVLLDGEARGDTRFISENHLAVTLPVEDMREAGVVTVSVLGGRTRSESAAAFVIAPSSMTLVWWDPLVLRPRWISLDSRLFALVLLMGALGATLASLYSLSNYRGEGKAYVSWSTYYFVSPPLGAGVSCFLYVVVRAGLMAGTNIELGSTTTPWGLVAVSGLAGMFYDKTLIKLREVFLTLFNPRDDRGGKLAQAAGAAPILEIVTKSLLFASVGEPYSAKLEARGGAEPYSWSVDPALPAGLTLDPLTGQIAGTPKAPTESKAFEFAVRDLNKKSVKTSLNLTIQ